MATFTDDWIARVLAVDYGFCPARIISPSKKHLLDSGKFEPDRKTFENRCFVLAHWKDHTNVIIQFDPLALEPVTD